MPTKITPAQWRTAVEGATNEIATHALSMPGAVVLDPVGPESAVSLIGAHIPMIGGGQAFDLALVASAEGCRALARAILYMAPDAPLRDAEFADPVGEIVNMLAGGVKRRIPGLDLTLGLPLFVHGYIEPTDRLMVTTYPVRFVAIETMVLITGQRG